MCQFTRLSIDAIRYRKKHISTRTDSRVIFEIVKLVPLIQEYSYYFLVGEPGADCRKTNTDFNLSDFYLCAHTPLSFHEINTHSLHLYSINIANSYALANSPSHPLRPSHSLTHPCTHTHTRTHTHTLTCTYTHHLN